MVYYKRKVYNSDCLKCPEEPQPVLSNSNFVDNTISERKKRGGTLRYFQERGPKKFIVLNTGRNRIGGATGTPGGFRKAPRNF
jgi:hypothetical protein